MRIIDIKIVNDLIYDQFSLPKYITPGSAGLDLLACINNSITVVPKKVFLIPTGIAINIFDPGIAGIILPRSGLGHYHGIILGNSIGLIDSDYQGEIIVSLWNRSEKVFILNPGKRIAQLLFISILKIKFNLVHSFIPSVRGNKGFGHSM